MLRLRQGRGDRFRGGYGRKLTFGDINGGLNYVADSTALKTYGRPDGFQPSLPLRGATAIYCNGCTVNCQMFRFARFSALYYLYSPVKVHMK